MLKIVSLEVKSATESANAVTVRLEGVQNFKKRRYRGTLEVKRISESEVECYLEIVHNTTGVESTNGEVLLHRAYKGESNQNDITFSTVRRFGHRLEDGPLEWSEVSAGDWDVTFRVKLAGEMPVAPSKGLSREDAVANNPETIRKIVAALYDSRYTKRDIREMLEEMANVPSAKPRQAIPAHTKAGSTVKLSDVVIRQIRVCRRTMTIQETAKKVGVSVSSVIRYQ